MMRTHFRTCNLCEAMCGLEIKVEGDRILSIKGDKKDPLSRGHICPKAVALQDIYYDEDRLKYPVRKTEAGWERIGWEEAYDMVVEKVRAVQAKYGRDSVGVYAGNPNVHNFGTLLYLPNFLRSLATKNRFSATSADQLPHHVAALFMFGHGFMIPIPDIDRTDFMLIIGANPLASNGSLMTAPDYAKRLKAIQKRGGKVVVIDPRKTETAQIADRHFFIPPGRDALLLAAMIQHILSEKGAQTGHLAPIIEGMESLKSALEAFTPEAVSAAVRISADDIRTLAEDFANAPRAVCHSRMGASTQLFGGLCQWLTNVLNLITGNMDSEGGAMFTLPAFDHVGFTGSQGKTGVFGNRKSRVRGLPAYGGEFPVSTLAEEILTPGEGQIKAMVTVAGNPVLSAPNGKLLDEAFEQLEFMVSFDIYINETTRHADLIIPPATGLETPHYDLIFNVFSIRNTAKYSPALFEKLPDQRYDWEIYKALTQRFTETPDDGSTPEKTLAFALENGPYGRKGLNLETLKAHPNGMDLGALRPCLTKRLFTKDKKIHIAPDFFIQDLPRLQKVQTDTPATDFPLALIGRRDLRSNNSWMHNSPRLVKGKNRCTVLIHPNDARAAGIEDGQIVRVESPTGRVELPAEVTENIMEGVVSIPHGWGHGRKGVRLRVAQKSPGVSINDLTDGRRIDALTGNAAFSGVPVRVEAI
ncbi:MAG: molybdopterin oxidoreductase family protein [Bacteroidetes bacterium]|nr:MAG: molybdopterin oxidoreductase family protein [Bacteroidota bacterium]